MGVLREMADFYETLRVHRGPMWTMLPTTMTEGIYGMSFRFEQDPNKKSPCLDTEQRARGSHQEGDGVLAIKLKDCPDTEHDHSPRNRRSRRPRRRRM